ncbi:MAG TPA: PQQ-binding-like beta-propeller repeat protein [Opitutus sp.]|nr:PQQ-binding-like beta-propeller repeat protein [Opitutus sp.]
MKTSCFRWVPVLLLALTGLAPLVRGEARQLWTAKLPADAKWHTLTDLGTLLVGTNDAILAYDPDSGQQLWTRGEFKKTSPFNAREIPGTPFLVCHTSEGFAGLAKVTLYEIDYLTGKTVWQTPPTTGQFLGAVPVITKDLVLVLLNSNGPDGKDNGTWIYAYNLADGTQKWATKFAKTGAIRLHMADNSGKFMPTLDLSGYHDPVVDGDDLYLPYLGCHCLDLNTGALKWAAEMIKGGSEFKLAHAPLRVTADRVYGSAGGSVYALEKATGKVLWKSDRISSYAGLLKARNNAMVSQLELVDGKLFARYGGNFSTGQAVVLAEPLGIVALDPASGEGIYHFDEAKEGLTNMMILPENHTVLFADAYNLYGIDTAGAKPAEAFRDPIEFKRKMGGGEIAQLGLGVLGGLRGLGKAAVSQNKARLDVPVAIIHRGEHIIVEGKQHLLCFDPAARKIAWSQYCPAPSDVFGMTALFAVTAAAGLAGNGMAVQGGYGSAGYDNGVDLVHSSLDRYNQQAGKRKSATKEGDAYTFMLTHVEDGHDKGVGLVGINLANGEEEKKFVLGTKEPDYQVDDVVGRLFFFKGRDTLVAYGL